MMAYWIQRMFGFSQIDAYNNLKMIREHTYAGVLPWRIDYAEKVLSRIDIKDSENIEQENWEEFKNEITE